MKAQLTLEYLMLVLVFMALLSLSIIAIYSIKESSERSMEIINFKSNVEKIDSKISEVCAMGNGNSRQTESDFPMNVSYYGNGIRFSYKNNSIPKGYLCTISGAAFFADKIYIENVNGKIVLN